MIHRGSMRAVLVGCFLIGVVADNAVQHIRNAALDVLGKLSKTEAAQYNSFGHSMTELQGSHGLHDAAVRRASDSGGGIGGIGEDKCSESCTVLLGDCVKVFCSTGQNSAEASKNCMTASNSTCVHACRKFHGSCPRLRIGGVFQALGSKYGEIADSAKQAMQLWVVWANKKEPGYTVDTKWVDYDEASFPEEIRRMTDNSDPSYVDTLVCPYSSDLSKTCVQSVSPNYVGPIIVWGGADPSIFTGVDACSHPDKNLKCFGFFTTAPYYMDGSLQTIDDMSEAPLNVAVVAFKDRFSKSVAAGVKITTRLRPGLVLQSYVEMSGTDDMSSIRAAMDKKPDVVVIAGHNGEVEPVVIAVSEHGHTPKAVLATNSLTDSATKNFGRKKYLMEGLIMPTHWGQEADYKDDAVGWSSQEFLINFMISSGKAPTHHAASAGGAAVAIANGMKTAGGVKGLANRMRKLDVRSFYRDIRFDSDGTITKKMYTMQRQNGSSRIFESTGSLCYPISSCKGWGANAIDQEEESVDQHCVKCSCMSDVKSCTEIGCAFADGKCRDLWPEKKAADCSFYRTAMSCRSVRGRGCSWSVRNGEGSCSGVTDPKHWGKCDNCKCNVTELYLLRSRKDTLVGKIAEARDYRQMDQFAARAAMTVDESSNLWACMNEVLATSYWGDVQVSKLASTECPYACDGCSPKQAEPASVSKPEPSSGEATKPENTHVKIIPSLTLTPDGAWIGKCPMDCSFAISQRMDKECIFTGGDTLAARSAVFVPDAPHRSCLVADLPSVQPACFIYLNNLKCPKVLSDEGKDTSSQPRRLREALSNEVADHLEHDSSADECDSRCASDPCCSSSPTTCCKPRKVSYTAEDPVVVDGDLLNARCGASVENLEDKEQVIKGFLGDLVALSSGAGAKRCKRRRRAKRSADPTKAMWIMIKKCYERIENSKAARGEDGCKFPSDCYAMPSGNGSDAFPECVGKKGSKKCMYSEPDAYMPDCLAKVLQPRLVGFLKAAMGIPADAGKGLFQQAFRVYITSETCVGPESHDTSAAKNEFGDYPVISDRARCEEKSVCNWMDESTRIIEPWYMNSQSDCRDGPKSAVVGPTSLEYVKAYGSREIGSFCGFSAQAGHLKDDVGVWDAERRSKQGCKMGFCNMGKAATESACKELASCEGNCKDDDGNILYGCMTKEVRNETCELLVNSQMEHLYDPHAPCFSSDVSAECKGAESLLLERMKACTTGGVMLKDKCIKYGTCKQRDYSMSIDEDSEQDDASDGDVGNSVLMTRAECMAEKETHTVCVQKPQMSARECRSCGLDVGAQREWVGNSLARGDWVSLEWQERNMVSVNRWQRSLDKAKLKEAFESALVAMEAPAKASEMKCIYSNVIDGLLKYNCGCGKHTDRSSLEICREMSTRDPVVAQGSFISGIVKRAEAEGHGSVSVRLRPGQEGIARGNIVSSAAAWAKNATIVPLLKAKIDKKMLYIKTAKRKYRTTRWTRRLRAPLFIDAEVTRTSCGFDVIKNEIGNKIGQLASDGLGIQMTTTQTVSSYSICIKLKDSIVQDKCRFCSTKPYFAKKDASSGDVILLKDSSAATLNSRQEWCKDVSEPGLYFLVYIDDGCTKTTAWCHTCIESQMGCTARRSCREEQTLDIRTPETNDVGDETVEHNGGDTDEKEETHAIDGAKGKENVENNDGVDKKDAPEVSTQVKFTTIVTTLDIKDPAEFDEVVFRLSVRTALGDDVTDQQVVVSSVQFQVAVTYMVTADDFDTGKMTRAIATANDVDVGKVSLVITNTRRLLEDHRFASMHVQATIKAASGSAAADVTSKAADHSVLIAKLEEEGIAGATVDIKEEPKTKVRITTVVSAKAGETAIVPGSSFSASLGESLASTATDVYGDTPVSMAVFDGIVGPRWDAGTDDSSNSRSNDVATTEKDFDSSMFDLPKDAPDATGKKTPVISKPEADSSPEYWWGDSDVVELPESNTSNDSAESDLHLSDGALPRAVPGWLCSAFLVLLVGLHSCTTDF